MKKRRHKMKKFILFLVLFPYLLISQELKPEELKKWIELREKGKKHFVLIDVRTPEEHEAGFIPGTDTLIPLQVIMEKFPKLKFDPEKDTIVLYCRTGHRAGIAQKIFKENGFKNVFNGLGIFQWKEAGFKLIKPQKK
jgi:rhodanese-related sulfurtransferase